MELIMQQKGIAQKAAKGWRDIWMPAVIELGENSRKPAVQSLLAEYETDETGIVRYSQHSPSSVQQYISYG